MEQEIRTSTEILICRILRGMVYRNAGEIPAYEGPIRRLMTALHFQNLSIDDQERIITVAVASFNHADYLGRGMIPAIEGPIQLMITDLEHAIAQSIALATARRNQSMH